MQLAKRKQRQSNKTESKRIPNNKIKGAILTVFIFEMAAVRMAHWADKPWAEEISAPQHFYQEFQGMKIFVFLLSLGKPQYKGKAAGYSLQNEA